jgi:hypothetical protein
LDDVETDCGCVPITDKAGSLVELEFTPSKGLAEDMNLNWINGVHSTLLTFKCGW